MRCHSWSLSFADEITNGIEVRAEGDGGSLVPFSPRRHVSLCCAAARLTNFTKYIRRMERIQREIEDRDDGDVNDYSPLEMLF